MLAPVDWSEGKRTLYRSFIADIARESSKAELGRENGMGATTEKDPKLFEAFGKCLTNTEAMFGREIVVHWQKHIAAARDRASANRAVYLAEVEPISGGAQTMPGLDEADDSGLSLIDRAARRYRIFEMACKEEWKSTALRREALINFAHAFKAYEDSRPPADGHSKRTSSETMRAVFRKLVPERREQLRDSFPPESIQQNPEMKKAYEAFSSSLKRGRRWARIVEKLGWGVLPLFPTRKDSWLERLPDAVLGAWLNMVPGIVPEMTTISGNAWRYFKNPLLGVGNNRRLKVERAYALAGELQPCELFEVSGSESEAVTFDPDEFLNSRELNDDDLINCMPVGM